MKAKKKAKRRSGRPRKEGVPRVPGSGRISRSLASRDEIKALETRLALEAATWKRRQVWIPGTDEKPGHWATSKTLTVEEARKPEYGSVIHAWKVAHDAFRKRHGDKVPDPMTFTAADLETARIIHEAYSAYCAAISARHPRSSSDFSGPGGHDGSDPFDEDRSRRDKQSIERWAGTGGIREAILNSGPFGMMAVESIVFENKPLDSLVGDLRLALNAVERLGRARKAA